jgi:predicted HTH domain antitoxin
MRTEKITFTVPEDILASLKMGVKRLEFDMRKSLALRYFKNKRLSHGKAAVLAGMNRFEFMDYLASEGVVLFDYDESIVTEELNGIKKLGELTTSTLTSACMFI